MEYARIRKEEKEMGIETENGMLRDLTQEDLVRLGLDRKGKWQYTVADIEALPECIRAELIDGELFVSMNTPAEIHQLLLGNLFFQIKQFLLKKKGDCEVYPAPFGVLIKKDRHNYVEPDILVVCDRDKLNEKGCYGAPDFVIEVVSPSNRKHDYVRKLALYREAGVREYWIVDPKRERVTVYDLEHGKEPVLYPFSERIPVGIYGDLYLNVTTRSDEMQEVLDEERQASRAEGLTEGIEKGRADGFTEGMEKGRAEGEERFAKLTALLLREGRTDDLAKALADTAYREGLYREFSI